jgi:hypothetical protein
MKTRELPPGVDPTQVATIVSIMGGQEALRSGSALPNAVMALQVAEKQGFPAALGALPMAPDDAVRQTRALDRRLKLRKDPESGPPLSKDEERDAQAALDREIGLLKLWIDSLGLKFDSPQAQITTLNELKRQIRKRIVNALRGKVRVPPGV